jgi:hypothetical protein
VLPDDGTPLPKHVADTPVISSYNYFRGFGWRNKLKQFIPCQFIVQRISIKSVVEICIICDYTYGLINDKELSV